MFRYLILILLLFLPKPAPAADPAQIGLDDRVRAITTELRCVVCQNLSVADSPSEMAQQMRAIVREQLQQGKSPEEIKAYFVSKYGEWVLLAPSKEGFSLLVWVLPFVAAAVGTLFVIFALRRWTRQTRSSASRRADPALLARVRDELEAATPAVVDSEALAAQSPYERERDRLYADIQELEFDYQAGKFSEADYSELRRNLEGKAAAVLEQIDFSRTAEKAKKEAPGSAASSNAPSARTHNGGGFRRWQMALGGAFLLLFGLALGVLLTQSLRPRGSDQDSITGDFLTGTGPGGIAKNSPGGDMNSLLQQGRAAFEARDWPKAIEAFKSVLAVAPDHPEAHTYMGLILIQAGHSDGALAAFDRALGFDPNFPLALWGKGMVLYRDKQDLDGARQALTKLVTLLPRGQERSEVEKVLADMPETGKTAQASPAPVKAAEAVSARIEGTISIGANVKDKVDPNAVLFIIARSGSAAAGPPLAVVKIDRPIFPLRYSVGPENAMMGGSAFTGKISISARLDKDGNAMTRESGNLQGEYRKNPADVGSHTIDIVLDQVAP